MVAGLVIIRMCIRVIPDDGDVLQGERAIVTAADGAVPGAVVRLQLQVMLPDGVFQPLAEGRMRFRVEIDHVLRLVRPVVAANHVEVQVALDLLHEGAGLHEIFGAQQPFLLPVPEGEDDVAQRLLARCCKRPCYLQGRRYARGIVVRPVINLVACQGGVIADVVEVCSDHHIFVRPFAGNPAQDVGQLQAAVRALLQPCQRIRMHLEASFLLPLHGACLERLVIRIAG